MCLQIYEFDFVRFLTVPGSEWKAALKNAKVKLHLWTDTDILLVIGKVAKVEHVMLFFDMLKLIINTSQIMIEINNNHILTIVM